MTRRTAFSPDPEDRWRPKGDGPVCGYTFDGKVCEKSGPHYCEPRADRPVRFHAELLVHTKGRWARRAFQLDEFQEREIIRPVFGEVVWSDDWECYVRRYRVAYIILGRKNGKSESAAGIVLFLLVGDDEEAAEVYGAAKDTKQAGKVADVVERMRQLSPPLAKRLKFNKNARRIYDQKTGSYFEVITSDALGELGHNPHGFYIDEVLSQPDGHLWDSLKTAAGSREQPLFLILSTETNDPESFGATMIDEAERIQEDPSRAPHVFAYVRKAPKTDEELARIRTLFKGHPDLPVSLDVFDERNWKWPNPALDSFLSREAMRMDALDAKNDPAKENAYRQYRMNQRVSQVTRFLPLHLWDLCAGEIWTSPDWKIEQYEGRMAWAGLDLSAKLDLTSWCLLFEDGTAWWRYWVPEASARNLDRALGGQLTVWAKQGWIEITDGDVIDYEHVYDAITTDVERFAIAEASYDKWSGEPVRQKILERTGMDMIESDTTVTHMTGPLDELTGLVQSAKLRHLGNPVSRWCADNLEVKRARDNAQLMRPVKPDRNKHKVRIDGMAALLQAIRARQAWEASNEQEPELYVSFS